MQRKQNCRNPFQRGTEIRTRPLKRSAAAAAAAAAAGGGRKRGEERGEEEKRSFAFFCVVYKWAGKGDPQKGAHLPRRKKGFFKIRERTCQGG